MLKRFSSSPSLTLTLSSPSRNAHHSETEALRTSHETIQTSLEADSSKEVSSLKLDLGGESS